jgi:acetyl esterase/lipase
LRWVTENAAKEFEASPEAGMVVGGYSAGGQVAAVVASEARFKGFTHPVTGSFICISLLFTDETVPGKYKDIFTSREENGAPPMGRESIQEILSHANADPSSPLFCPLYHSHGLNGLPRTYVQVGGRDCVRDDGIIYTKLLQDAGVETRSDNHEALGHESWTIFTDKDAPHSTELKDKTLDAMKWLLRK